MLIFYNYRKAIYEQRSSRLAPTKDDLDRHTQPRPNLGNIRLRPMTVLNIFIYSYIRIILYINNE